MADVSNTAPLQPLLCAQRVWGKRWQQRSGARPAPGGGEAVPGPDRAAPTLSAVPAWPRCPPPPPPTLVATSPGARVPRWQRLHDCKVSRQLSDPPAAVV